MKYPWTLELTNQIFRTKSSLYRSEKYYKLAILRDTVNNKIYYFAVDKTDYYPYDKENNCIHDILSVKDNDTGTTEYFIKDFSRSESLQKTISESSKSKGIYSATFKSLDKNSNMECRFISHYWGLFSPPMDYLPDTLIYCPKTTPIDYRPYCNVFSNYERNIFYSGNTIKCYDHSYRANFQDNYNYSNYPDLDEQIFVEYNYAHGLKSPNANITKKYTYSWGSQNYYYHWMGNPTFYKYTNRTIPYWD